MSHIKSGILIIAVATLTACANTPQQPPKIDRISAEELAKIVPETLPNLKLEDIVSLSKQNMPAEEIIEKIKSSQSSYDLSPSQSLALSKQGVDVKVLDFIHMQRENIVRDSYADEINKREAENKKALKKLELEQRLRTPYYDPFFNPYWGWRYRSRFRNRFYFGSGF